MKPLLSLFAILLACIYLSAADPAVKASPRFKARVVCFNGKLDSGSSCAGTNFQPDGALHAKGKMTCGFPGQVSEIEYAFVERRGDKDVYRFTRRFPSDTAAASTTSKTVEFNDNLVRSDLTVVPTGESGTGGYLVSQQNREG